MEVPFQTGDVQVVNYTYLYSLDFQIPQVRCFRCVFGGVQVSSRFFAPQQLRRSLHHRSVRCVVFFRIKNLLGQWLNFKLFGVFIFSRENKVQTFFFRVHWLSEETTEVLILVGQLRNLLGLMTLGLLNVWSVEKHVGFLKGKIGGAVGKGGPQADRYK